MDLQECSQETKEFSGKAVLFSGLTLMSMDVFCSLFFFFFFTEKIRSIYIMSTGTSCDTVQLKFTKLAQSNSLSVCGIVITQQLYVFNSHLLYALCNR